MAEKATLEPARERRHVLEAEEHVRAQRELIHRLEGHGVDTGLARHVLATFEESLRLAREDLKQREREGG
jgi:hypothetical protein